MGLSASPALQCLGLTGTGLHRADEPIDQRPRGSNARRLSPTKDSRLPRPDHHPARSNNDVFPSASPSWLSSMPATTPFNSDRGATSKKTPRKLRPTSKKTQAPHACTVENLRRSRNQRRSGGSFGGTLKRSFLGSAEPDTEGCDGARRSQGHREVGPGRAAPWWCQTLD